MQIKLSFFTHTHVVPNQDAELFFFNLRSSFPHEHIYHAAIFQVF